MKGFTKNSRTAYICPFSWATYRSCPYLFIFAKKTHQNSHTHKYWNFYRSNDSDFRFGKFLNKIKESLSLIKDHSKNQKQKQNSYLAENHSLSWMLMQEKQNIPIWVYWVSARLNISYIISIWYQGYRSIGDNNVLNFKMSEIVTRFFLTNKIYCSQWNICHLYWRVFMFIDTSHHVQSQLSGFLRWIERSRLQIQIQKGTIPVLFGIIQIKLFGISI